MTQGKITLACEHSDRFLVHYEPWLAVLLRRAISARFCMGVPYNSLPDEAMALAAYCVTLAAQHGIDPIVSACGHQPISCGDVDVIVPLVTMTVASGRLKPSEVMARIGAIFAMGRRPS